MRREGVFKGAIGVGVFETDCESSFMSAGDSPSSSRYTDAESLDDAGLEGVLAFAASRPRAS
jgi:hypothetical protein